MTLNYRLTLTDENGKELVSWRLDYDVEPERFGPNAERFDERIILTNLPFDLSTILDTAVRCIEHRMARR